MGKLFGVLSLTLSTLLLGACALFGCGPDTISWQEDVSLISGRSLLVQRVVTFGRDQFGRRGRGAVTRQEITFDYGGKHIKWVYDEYIRWMPVVLEIVEEKPVIILPVSEWLQCYTYGFPREGMVAFRFEDDHWVKVPVAEVPQSVEINLLQSTHEIRYWSEYKNKRITAEDKRRIEDGPSGGPKQGTPLSEATSYYSGVRESCQELRPAPNSQLESALKRNIEEERLAPELEAEVVAVRMTPEVISREAFPKRMGGGIDVSCKDIVARIDNVIRWTGDEVRYRQELVGHRVIIRGKTDGETIVPFPRSKEMILVCDNTSIFLLSLKEKHSFTIYRLSHSGDLKDVFRVLVPSIEDVFPDQAWVPFGNAALTSQGNMVVSFVKYQRDNSGVTGGTIVKSIEYLARLPKEKTLGMY